jgi:hypothetical protein
MDEKDILREDLEQLLSAVIDDKLREYEISSIEVMVEQHDYLQERFRKEVVSAFLERVEKSEIDVSPTFALGVVAKYLKPWKHLIDDYLYTDIYSVLGEKLAYMYVEGIEHSDTLDEAKENTDTILNAEQSERERKLKEEVDRLMVSLDKMDFIIQEKDERINELEALTVPYGQDEVKALQMRIAELEDELEVCKDERDKAIDNLRDIASNGRAVKHQHQTTNIERIEAFCMLLATLTGLELVDVTGRANHAGGKPIPVLGSLAGCICGVAGASKRLSEVREAVTAGGTTIGDGGKRRGIQTDIQAVVNSIQKIRG